MSLETTLCDAASSCQDAFRECLSISELARDSWIENRLGDFNLWVATLHVRDTGHASLDYRLRERQDVKNVVQGLLHILLESLHQCKVSIEYETETCSAFPENDQSPESEDSDSSLSSLSSTSNMEENEVSCNNSSQNSTESRLWEEANNVKMALDQLIRLGMAIRKSGTHFRHVNADKSLNKRDHVDFERHLTFILLYGAEEHRLMVDVLSLVRRQIIPPTTGIVIKSMLLNPARLTPIQQRVIQANIVRRNRFEFMRKREQGTVMQNLQEPPQNILTPPVRPKTSAPTINQIVSPVSTGVVERTTTHIPLQPSVIMTATQVGSQLILQRDTPKKPGTQVTKVSATGLALDYPKCPLVLNGRNVFQCPYCLHILPEKYAKAGWSAHVHQDILPYICILQECSTPNQLYASKEEWLSHMRSQHSAQFWKCPFQTLSLCFESRFLTKEDWMNHINNNHKNSETITDAQLQLLAGINMVQEMSTESCPLCGFFEKNNQASTIDHVAQHLHSFSLRSLPWIAFPGEESNASQGSPRKLSFAESIGGNTSSSDVSVHYSQTWTSISGFLDRLSIIIDEQKGSDMDLKSIVQSFLPKLQSWFSALQSEPQDPFIVIEREDGDLASRINSCLMDVISCFDVLEEYCTNNYKSRSPERLQNLHNQLQGVTQGLIAQQNDILAFNDTSVEPEHMTIGNTHGKWGEGKVAADELSTAAEGTVRLSYDDYKIAWICGLPLEMAAAKALLDESHEPLPSVQNDPNPYALGKISGHNIVIVCPPAGTSSVAAAATRMFFTFRFVQIGVMVGIGGGVPSQGPDIRLGDVVVNIPTSKPSGMVEYYYGERFVDISPLEAPSSVWLKVVSHLQSDDMIKEIDFEKSISNILNVNKKMQQDFGRPEYDQLFSPEYIHADDSSDCSACDQNYLVKRAPRDFHGPQVHYGLISSGNTVIKDAKLRDAIAQKQDILCLETQAAGLMNLLPCLVIRGISDYCDSHKDEKWQGYAALAAAVYCKSLLEQLNGSFRRRQNNILKRLHVSHYQEQKDRNPERMPGTCEWFIHHPVFESWRKSKSQMLWVSANPGCGKSVLAKYLADSVLANNESRTIGYFFFNDDFSDQRSITTALCCILSQLFLRKQNLLTETIVDQFEMNDSLTESFSELWTILINIAKDKNSGEIICLLDAFDACENQGQSRLTESLHQLYADKTGQDFNLKFLITSRPYGHIRRGFQPLKILHLSGESDTEMDKISQEINLVIEARVDSIGARFGLTEEDQAQLFEKLTSVPNRTYLWVDLILDFIETDIDFYTNGIARDISNLPPAVDKAYQQILSRCTSPENARKILCLVVGAERHLRLQEMDIAMALENGHKSYKDLTLMPEEHFREAAIDICGLFITVIDSRIYLLHQTAREFLVNAQALPSNIQRPLLWKHSIQLQKSHSILATICIQYLLFADFEKGQSLEDDIHKLISTYGFLEYSAQYWTTHLLKSDLQMHTMIPSLLEICDTTTARCTIWLRIYWSSLNVEFPTGFTTLMVASYFGLSPVVKHLVKMDGVDLEAKDDVHGRSALSWAAGQGHSAVVELLTRRPWKSLFRKGPSVDSVDKSNRTPLSWAILNGHEDTVNLLRKVGASTNPRNDI